VFAQGEEAMNKRTVMKYFTGAVRVAEEIRVNAANWSKHAPVFIYQPGKVGSSSVYTSLRKSLKSSPVYHVHFLMDSGIKQAVQFHRESSDPVLPHHLVLSQVLRKRLDRESNFHMKIITLIREPVGRALSDVFENIHRSWGQYVGNDEITDLEGLRAEALRSLTDPAGPVHFIEQWQEKELKLLTGIDLLAEPFDEKKGWNIYENERASVLLIRLEDLSNVYSEAICSFLNIPEGEAKLVNANIGQKKWYSDEYQIFRKEFSVPEAVCSQLYSSRFIQHFYPDKIEGFTGAWSA